MLIVQYYLASYNPRRLVGNKLPTYRPCLADIEFGAKFNVHGCLTAVGN